MAEHWLAVVDSLGLDAETAEKVRELVIRESTTAHAAGVIEGGERAAGFVWDVLSTHHPDALQTLRLCMAAAPGPR